MGNASTVAQINKTLIDDNIARIIASVKPSSLLLSWGGEMIDYGNVVIELKTSAQSPSSTK